MSISPAGAVSVVHPLPVPEVCPYQCCRSEPSAEAAAQAGRTQLAEHHHPPERLTAGFDPALCPSLEQPCVATGMHCPSLEPLEALVAERRRQGWSPAFDAVEAGVAAASVCGACGGQLCYLALASAAGAPATAWAICPTCRHWVQL
jgi:hypothetical protein